MIDKFQVYEETRGVTQIPVFGSQFENILKKLPISELFQEYLGMEVPKFGTIMPNKVISGGHISGGHFSGGHISGGDFSIGNVSGGHFSGGYFSGGYFSVYCLMKC